MNGQIVSALVAKDLILFFRNRFFAFITVLALVAYAAVYFLMPARVDETLEMGLYAPTLPPALEELMQEESLVVQRADSEEALRDAIVEGQYHVGIVLSPDAVQRLTAGQKGQMKVYFISDFPDDLKDAYTTLLQELAYTISGRPLNIEATEEILGPDMVGQQIPPRDRMVPLFAVFILIMETMGVASLISEEIEGGTLRALLVTPMRVEGLFLGKGVLGVGLAFVQAALLMAITGGLSRHPLLILLTLLLGALLVTGIGFMMASVGKDMMSVMAWGVLAMVVLAIPAFGVLFPGTVSDWVRVIPSFYLVDTVHRVTNFNVGWGNVWQNLLILLAFAALFLWLGVVVLRRKFR